MNIYIMHLDGQLNHPEDADIFLQAARELVGLKQKQMFLANDTATLEIKTDYKYRSLGTIFGIEFTATFENEHGKSTLTYIVRNNALQGDDHIGGLLAIYPDALNSLFHSQN